MDNQDVFSDSGKPNVLLIDDEHFIHDLVSEALADCCCLISVETGEDALMATHQWKPDLIIVDVEMPGMGGYETCRQFKVQEETAHIPIMFISGHDQIEDRLKGYEAGGEDYLTKPFDLAELKTKVLNLLAMVASKSELKSMADFASSAAMTAMTSMSEMGAMLEILKKFNTCEDWPCLAKTAIDGLAVFDLHGAVLVRTSQGSLIVTDHGPATPLEESVIEHMAEMDRIVHFRSRMSINYERVSLLVNNMPEHDEDRCGRLRDHLAMLVEAADVRVKSIITMQESSSRGGVIDRTLSRITEALHEIDAEQRRSQINTRLAVDEMYDRVDKALLSVALSDAQELFLNETIRHGIEGIINSQSNQIDLQNRLSDIIKELKSCMPAKQVKQQAEIHLWTDKMLLGVKMMDDDHRKLVEMINALVMEINQDAHKDMIIGHLTAIARYATEHFKREETFMAGLNYPGVAVHKAEHERLILEVYELRTRLGSGSVSLTPNIIKYMQGWFIDHIHGPDTELAKYVQKRA